MAAEAGLLASTAGGLSPPATPSASGSLNHLAAWERTPGSLPHTYGAEGVIRPLQRNSHHHALPTRPIEQSKAQRITAPLARRAASEEVSTVGEGETPSQGQGQWANISETGAPVTWAKAWKWAADKATVTATTSWYLHLGRHRQ